MSQPNPLYDPTSDEIVRQESWIEEEVCEVCGGEGWVMSGMYDDREVVKCVCRIDEDNSEHDEVH